MNYNDIIGSAGVGLILLAYFLNTTGLLTGRKQLFFILNIVGAGLACYASYLLNYWPFIILEGTWVLVSIYGLFTARN
jgi:hypothetical protein